MYTTLKNNKLNPKQIQKPIQKGQFKSFNKNLPIGDLQVKDFLYKKSAKKWFGLLFIYVI